MTRKAYGFSSVVLLIVFAFFCAVAVVAIGRINRQADQSEQSTTNAVEQKENKKSAQQSGPNLPDPQMLVTPYYDASLLEGIGAYSASEQTAYKRFHNGIDFMATTDLVEFRAITDGIVENVAVFRDEKQPVSRPQVNMNIRINDTWSYGLAFEPFSFEYSDAEQQLSLISVKAGDSIKQGQLIGKLLNRGDGAHVHISVKKNGQDICFSDMFSSSDKKTMEAIVLVSGSMPRQLCYE